MTHIVLIAIFALLMLPAVAAAFIPMFPAFWYLIAVTGAYLLVDGFAHITALNAAILLGIFFLSIAVDWSAGLLGAKFGGAAWKSILCGSAGSIIGLFLFPPLGVFAGLFAGVLAGEVLRRRSHTEAIKAAAGALIGSVAGTAINALLALAFIVLFVLSAIS